MTTSIIRTLFILRTWDSLYPPVGGVFLRNWQNINLMMKFGPVAVFGVSLPDDLNYHTESPPGVAVWSLNRVSDGQPSLQENVELWLRQLKSLLINRHPFTAAGAIYRHSIIRELNRVLLEFQPHVVVFEEMELYCYLPAIKRYPCRVILDAHNVETFRSREVYKPEEIKGLKAKFRGNLELVKTACIERDFIRQADRVWVCSDRDANLIQKISAKVPQAHVVSNGVDIAYYDSVRLGHHSLPTGWEPQPWTIIFPATFSYEPNKVATRLLLNEVFPQLQKAYPNCRLLLVGINPTEWMLEAAEQNPSIVVTGKVPDIRPYLSAASVMIVPLLQGGGTRLKILEAFAAGLPVVSTSKGAEGLKVQDGKHLLIGDDPKKLTADVCRLWSEPHLGKKLADSAFDLVRMEYSWEAIGQSVEKAVRELL